MKLQPRRPLSLAEAAALAQDLSDHGRTLVFTNGVFDLLHPGHIRYLRDARAFGDALVVGMNTDRSVRSLKGPLRPIVPETERAELLLALSVIDAVVLFDDATPQSTIDLLQPDVLVKGADWAASEIVGREVVEAKGGTVVRIAFSPGHSTTSLIDRVQRASSSSRV